MTGELNRIVQRLFEKAVFRSPSSCDLSVLGSFDEQPGDMISEETAQTPFVYSSLTIATLNFKEPERIRQCAPSKTSVLIKEARKTEKEAKSQEAKQKDLI